LRFGIFQTDQSPFGCPLQHIPDDLPPGGKAGTRSESGTRDQRALANRTLLD
jgi:hypothetical protein